MKINRRRWSRVVSQILVWCGDEPLVLSYDGSEIWVPPIDKVAKVGIGSPYRLTAATTKDGRPMTGTVVVEDVILDTGEGGHKKVFDVTEFCAFLERDCPEHFRRGFNIVSDPDDVRDVQLEGRPMYEESLDSFAQDIIEGELARRKRLEEQGRPITAASNEREVIWAFKHKQKRGTAKPAVSTADLFGAVSGTFVASPEEVAASPVVPDTGRASAAAILEECEELGVTLLKTELVALIQNDPEQVPIILEKIALKKKQAAEAMPVPATP